MQNWSCAFLGQSKFDYEPYQSKILSKIEYLIQRGVTHFYNCYRNSFDAMCAAAVDKLRESYQYIKHILVLPFKPQEDFALPKCFDEAVYLQENDVPTRFAVRNTHRQLVRSAGFVICGVARKCGGAKAIYNFAKRALKPMYDVVTDKFQFWHAVSPKQIEDAIRDYEERMKTDEVFRLLQEEMRRRYTEQMATFAEKQRKKNKNKKPKVYTPPVWVVAVTNKTTEK